MSREAIEGIQERIGAFQETLIGLAEGHLDTLLPGMTHLQHAQPVRLAHHLLAYFWMLARDDERLKSGAGEGQHSAAGGGRIGRDDVSD